MGEEKKKRHIGWKILGWVLGILLLIVLLLPAALYIPWVQDKAREYACQWASEKTGMDISVGRVLLEFPLDVRLDDVQILDQNRDTMLVAENLTASVAPKPLLKGLVQVDAAQLTRGRYHLVTEDSSLVLNAHVDHCRFEGIGMDLSHQEVTVADGSLTGGNVDLVYLPHKKKQEADTTQTDPWHIRAYKLALNDVTYTMQMPPTMDTMRAYVKHAQLVDGLVDTGTHTVNAQKLSVDSADVKYVYPPEKWAKQYAQDHPIPPDTLPKTALDSLPWTVKADSLRLTRSHAIYAKRDARPKAKGSGLNMDYIELNDMNVAVNDFYNCGTEINVPIESLSGSERSGIEIKQATGTLAMNDRGVDVKDFKMKTWQSDIALDGHIDQDMLENKPGGYMDMRTDSKVSLQEIAQIFPEVRPMIKDIPKTSPIAIKADVNGNTDRVNIRSLTATMPRYASATVKGTVISPMDPKRMAGDIDFDAKFDNIDFVKPTLMDKAMQRQVNLPPMAVKGKAQFGGDKIVADATMRLAGGELVGRGSFNSKSQQYDVDATFTNFPVKAILPLSDTDKLTAHITASGQGFDFTNSSTGINASIDLAGVDYNNAFYRNLKADVNYNGGNLDGHITSSNPGCDVDLDVNGTINGKHYVLDANGIVRDLDLKALNLYNGQACRGHGLLHAQADVNLATREYDVAAELNDFEWNINGDQLAAQSATASFFSNDSTTEATFVNEDNMFNFSSTAGLDRLIKDFKRSADIAIDQYERRSVNIDTLKQALPPFTLDMKMGTDGLVQRYLSQYDIDFRQLNAKVRNDSNIFIDGSLRSFSMGSTSIDTLDIKATEWKEYLAFNAHMGNRPGTWDEMAQVSVEGGVKGSTIDFLLKQQNIKKEIGYRVGCKATLTDSAVNMNLFPDQAVIGYRKWDINKNNFVNYDYTQRMLDADLKLKSDSSLLYVYTKREPGASQEDILVDIDNLRIEEWTQLVPSLKDMSGRLDADLELKFDGKNAEGMGDVKLKDFVYNGYKEGDFDLKTRFDIDPATATTRLNADVMLDGGRVAIAHGTLNDTTSQNPLNLSLTLERFPLRKVSPFIPGRLIRLQGYVDGELALGGTSDAPMINGYIVGDSAYVKIPKYGSSLRMSNDKIILKNNVIDFESYKLYGANNQAVDMNGKVDMRDLSNPFIDLRLKGRNVQVIASEQRTFSEIFGNGYADIDATVRSRNNNLDVRTDVKVLSGSNITYVMKNEVSAINEQVDESMVTFVNMNDSIGGVPNLITAAASSSKSIAVNVNVEQGSKINVFLSEDGLNRATVDGSGLLKYSLDFAGKDNLNGTYTIESGNFRYSPPLISQKNFNIASGSTLVWTGDMLNPQLKITASEHVKTSVSNEDSGSRLVDFLITAKVGGTLSNIDLSFDISTESDMTVQNELHSMSDVQRSQAAINMLLYNTYSGTNTAGNINNLTASTALFSFLQSQLNNWAAKTMKGVDLSFGINQYAGTKSGGIQTSYSYRLSKNLFNDRFKIIVGGEYSTDASAEENFSQNLINDISVEYNLNKTGSRYLRLFRHTGFESVLEGQITKTGVGFVMKHKLGSIDELFPKRWRKHVNQPVDTVAPNKGEEPSDSLHINNE